MKRVQIIFSARALMWLWATIELVNGVGHPLWSLAERRDTPGVATAPVLLVIAVSLAHQLLSALPTAPTGGR